MSGLKKKTVLRDEADMSVQKLDSIIALIEKLIELNKEESAAASETSDFILSGCEAADFPTPLELIKETEMTREELDMVKRSEYGHIMAFTNDPNERVGHCVPVGVITKQEKANLDASEDLAAMMLLLHKIVQSQMMLTASFMQEAEDCGIFRTEEGCAIRNADGSSKCLWRDDTCTDSPGFSAQKIKIAAEKLRNLRTHLLEVRRALAGFPTQYTPDMPAPAIPDPVYDKYKQLLTDRLCKQQHQGTRDHSAKRHQHYQQKLTGVHRGSRPRGGMLHPQDLRQLPRRRLLLHLGAESRRGW